MISASELRAGNIHKHPGLCIPREGISPVLIDNQSYVKITPYGIHMVNEGHLIFDPILINNTWLEAFGFVREGSEWGDCGAMEFRNKENLYLLYVDQPGSYIDEDALGLWVGDSWETTDFLIPLHRVLYVHQLQNIVFDLSGEELKLKH